MAQRSFKLDDELDARLISEAKRQGRSVSNLIVWALAKELTDPPPSVPGREPQWESPGVSAQRMADEAAKKGLDKQKRSQGRAKMYNSDTLPVEGTPLPKIARRNQR